MDSSASRQAPLEMDADRFRAIGHALVDQIAASLDAIPRGPVTKDRTPAAVREALGLNGALPSEGVDAATLLSSTATQLFEHSLFNAHPRFWGYITSSPAPIGILGDFLASALNPNVGAWTLSPAASEIEAQAVRWIAELVGYPTGCGGIFVSGGNMANIVCFLAARATRASWDVRRDGLASSSRQLLVYASAETHTWIQKATDLAGLGTASIRWIPTDDRLRMDVTQLERRIDGDIAAGHVPLVVIGTAGSVSTGAVDPLVEIARVCKERSIWFHVDGAYGAIAAAATDAPDDLRALNLADSIAVDPHKWLYAPLEAGCALVRDAAALRAAFSYHPVYYHFDEQGINYVDYGPQNSRGFRALKVWLALKQVGADGYRTMIADDMALSRAMAAAVEREPDLQLVTQALSIATFRFVPTDLRSRVGETATEEYLNRINEALLDAIQRGGEAFVSNALVRGRYVLRACIVNFHTTRADVEAVPEIVVRTGRELDARMRASAAV
ncbi:MAG TPA: aminotransferase class V-fold PLP-dependent enzyme [Vicinamibacterales bacterium]|nr:aminotransferase class V-fold PLP-dependent enzyme [Vicinamibacterales bacterium]